MAKPSTQRRSAPAETAPETKAVAVKTTNNALANTSVPEFMKADRGQGVENIGQGDIETPRIKLLQGVSPEVENFDNAKPGEFWHTIMDISLGSTVKVVPVYIDMRAILWRPRHEGGGILARSDDGVNWSPQQGKFTVRPNKDSKETAEWELKPTVAASGLLEWGSSNPKDPNSPPAATRMYNVAVAFPDHPEVGVAVVTLQRTSIRVARKWMGKLKMLTAPSYGAVFEMTRFKDDNGSGDEFWNYQFNAQGFVKDIQEYNLYKEYYEAFKRMGLNIRDLETAEEDVVVGRAEDAEPPTNDKVKY